MKHSTQTRTHLLKKLLATATSVAVAALVLSGCSWSGEPSGISERCQAKLSSHTTVIDIEQAENAALIAGMTIKRSLVPRAASIALATAYQESKIRNLDYGHSDSIGIFQQRPSQGWGTIEEIMDPWYSTTQFYKTMERVKKWETKDINDVAQAVQRSAFPQAYRQHESNARALASALTGETPAVFSCSIQLLGNPEPKAMTDFLTKTYGKKEITVTSTRGGLVIDTSSPRVAWAVAQGAVANAKRYGIAKVQTQQHSWQPLPWKLSDWEDDENAPTNQVLITFTTG